MQIEILKVHGSNNDFILIDELSHDYNFSEELRRDLAILLCNRNSNLGADGILFTMKSEVADARMRVFNSDGSEASMCGNGLRCVARYVCELLKLEEATIETMKANLLVKKQSDIFPDIPTYLVEISPVLFNLKDLPLNLPKDTLINEKIERLSNELYFTAVAVPNPHLITVVENLDGLYDFQKEISESLNSPNDLFPDGVNVSFVKILEKGHIYVRTFERGVGFTNACGTAMSASTLVTCLLEYNRIEEKIHVYNDGGMVNCVVHHENGVYRIDLIGNATNVFKATVEVDEHQENFLLMNQINFDGENETYTKLQEHVSNYLSR